MEITFYTFSKRRNSTAIPSGGTTFQCILKEPSDIYSPDIQLNIGVIKNPTNWNYCHIVEFSRYYYVEWEYVDSLWIAHCIVDVLSSFKSDIGAANLYILRAANKYNSTIVDAAYPITTQIETEVTDGQCPWIRYDENSSGGSTSGLYVIGIAGGGGEGAVTYYGMDKEYFQQFSHVLYNTSSWMGINWDTVIGISEQILKTLMNPGQYIVSAKWFPLDVYGQGITMTNTIKLGWWELSQQCYIINFPTLTYHIATLDFPRHPQAKQLHGDFTDFKPYSYYYFYTEPFGVIELDRSDFREDLVWIDLWIDMITGEAELRFMRKGQKIVKIVKVPFAVDVPVLQMSINPIGTAGGIVQYYSSTVGGLSVAATPIISGGSQSYSGTTAKFAQGIANTSQSMGGALGGIGNTISSLIPQGSIINSQSSFMDFINNTWEFRAKHYLLSPLSRENIGQALCQTENIAQLGGYILPGEVNFKMHGSLREQNECRALMSNGFYFE